jgi:hypothetical protein
MALHGMARKEDGTIWLWGQNDYGQIGDGSTISINTPFQLVAPTGMNQVAVGNVHSMATKDDGSVWMWGWNLYGNLGDGGNTDVYTPLEITALCTVLATCVNTFNTVLATSIDSYTAPSGAVYTSSGTYNDTIPNAAGCDSIITIDLTLEFTGIGELKSEIIQLSPNPASNAINIKGINDLIDVQEIKLISMTGSVLLKSNSILKTIDVSNLARGVYYIHITHSDGIVSVPFVKE